MKKMNKKGFTLIELLAVIVVLAIIMVIATQQINKTISRTRAKSMISSIEMAAKGVKTKMADGSMAACNDNTCLKDVIDYDADEEYKITVEQSSDGSDDWVITLTAVKGSEFESADFGEVTGYDDTTKKVGKIEVVQPKKDGNKLPEIKCTVSGETGSIK